MSSNSTEELTPADPLEFGLIVAVSAIGLFLNCISIIVLAKHKTFRNPFGFLTILHTVGNIGVLLIYLFYISPQFLITPLSPSTPSWWDERLGQLSLLFGELSFHSCLCISINRLIALSSPMFYRYHFTNSYAARLIIFVCIYMALYSCIYFIDGCDFYFDLSQHTFVFSSTSCGTALETYIDLYYNVVLFGIIMSLDLITLTLLRRASKRLLSESSEHGRKTAHREIRFFLQAFTNSLVYALMEVFFHVVSLHATTRLTQFLTTTFAWALSHASGGLILVLFNKEIWRIFVSPRQAISLLLDGGSTIVPASNRRSEDVTII